MLQSHSIKNIEIAFKLKNLDLKEGLEAWF